MGKKDILKDSRREGQNDAKVINKLTFVRSITRACGEHSVKTAPWSHQYFHCRHKDFATACMCSNLFICSRIDELFNTTDLHICLSTLTNRCQITLWSQRERTTPEFNSLKTITETAIFVSTPQPPSHQALHYNIIDSRTRGATKQGGTYQEPGDEEGLPSGTGVSAMR